MSNNLADDFTASVMEVSRSLEESKQDSDGPLLHDVQNALNHWRNIDASFTTNERPARSVDIRELLIGAGFPDAKTVIRTASKSNLVARLNEQLKQLQADMPWANARWIKANSNVTSDDVRTARNRGKQIATQQSGSKHPEYLLTDIEREFPAKAKGIVKKFLSLKA